MNIGGINGIIDMKKNKPDNNPPNIPSKTDIVIGVKILNKTSRV